MGMYEKGVVSVRIFGREYPIASDQNPEYVQKLADYVDRKMNAIAAAGDTFASGKVAVQACLDIADDLMRAKTETQQVIRSVHKTITSIAKLIEDRVAHRRLCSGVTENQKS
jgi:cell division protein ZapA